MKSKFLVTGAAGFIGSEFIRQSVKRGHGVAVVDKLTYAGDLERLREVKRKYKFYRADITSRKEISSIFRKEKPEVIVHFAAETHVDRSIRKAAPFIDTNIKGTQILLEVSRKIGVRRFVHISTDEVYGEAEKGKFSENAILQPNSPYAASKASSDLIIKSYIRTYDFPAIIIRPCNNYGPWQYPEKFIPVIIAKALNNEKVPLYGKGINRREWLYVSDCVDGILKITQEGRIRQIYNLGSGDERQNVDLAKEVIGVLRKPHSLITFVQDRPGHDFRYHLDSSKISKLGWKPKMELRRGIEETVSWYIKNLSWLENKVKCLRTYWKELYKYKEV